MSYSLNEKIRFEISCCWGRRCWRDKKDIILLATKATDRMEAAHALGPVLKKDGFLISLQNGICEDELASYVGKNRVIGCVTGWGATMESKGKLVMTSFGDFILGYPGKVFFRVPPSHSFDDKRLQIQKTQIFQPAVTRTRQTN